MASERQIGERVTTVVAMLGTLFFVYVLGRIIADIVAPLPK